MFPTRMKSAFSETGPEQRVGTAIALAAARTGVDFGYLVNQAKVESGFDPSARAHGSSATGLYQFIEQTWLGTVKAHGGAHGLGWAADAIRQGVNGRFHVADTNLRDAILDLRNEPEAASAMAAEFAADNSQFLEERLGRPVEKVDLYLAHFLGPQGAAHFLSMHDADPAQPAAHLLPSAARSNRAIFYDKAGAARSLGDIREHFARKIEGEAFAPSRHAATSVPIPSSPLEAPSFRPTRCLESDGRIEPIAKPSAHYARVAYSMLANLGA